MGDFSPLSPTPPTTFFLKNFCHLDLAPPRLFHSYFSLLYFIFVFIDFFWLFYGVFLLTFFKFLKVFDFSHYFLFFNSILVCFMDEIDSVFCLMLTIVAFVVSFLPWASWDSRAMPGLQHDTVTLPATCVPSAHTQCGGPSVCVCVCVCHLCALSSMPSVEDLLCVYVCVPAIWVPSAACPVWRTFSVCVCVCARPELSSGCLSPVMLCWLSKLIHSLQPLALDTCF